MYGHTLQLRLVYGFIDEDGDNANSNFLLFDGQDDLVINFLLYMEAVHDCTLIKPACTPKDLTGLQKPKKLRRREKELESTSLYRYSYVGRSYESRIKPEEAILRLPEEC